MQDICTESLEIFSPDIIFDDTKNKPKNKQTNEYQVAGYFPSEVCDYIVPSISKLHV